MLTIKQIPSKKGNMSHLIITDLTMFRSDKVCIAGLDMNNGRCIRPMPYISRSTCDKWNLFPGAILSGTFSPSQNLSGPHQEDMNYINLSFERLCTSDEFKAALISKSFDSISTGFNISLSPRQKSIPLNHHLTHSIITIKVKPKKVVVINDGFNKTKLKLHFQDFSGATFSYFPITDLRFNLFAMQQHNNNGLLNINNFNQNKSEAFLRIGLTRPWGINAEEEKYWMQVNGIYTF